MTASPPPKKRRSKRFPFSKSTGSNSTGLRVLNSLHWLWIGFIGVALLSALAIFYASYLDTSIRQQFEGKRWTVPARVYARPLELFPGAHISAKDLDEEMASLGYRTTMEGQRPGSFERQGNEVVGVSRAFTFWDGEDPAIFFRAVFDDTSLVSLKDAAGKDLPLVRLDPYQFASISPAHNEDRILVRLDQVPPLLINSLIAVEDRKFYRHHGLDPKGLLRALWANVSAGKVVQGGSTLTQQLVKNFFLTSERSIGRKLKEAMMAPLLEWHYDKAAILEAYSNEIYLGQDGKRAIHGFGLASQFYFGNNLHELQLPEIALLIGLVRGPIYYDPRRHPERALARRNQVLDILASQKVVSPKQAEVAKAAGLGVISRFSGTSRFPAFLELVRQQLRRDYREVDLQSEGLQIFTTLDPRIQNSVETSLVEGITDVEKRRGLKTKALEGAAIVTDTNSGEVLAVAGGRQPEFAGFNRALNAARHVGSLIKPAVYLTALELPERYTLATALDDSTPLTIKSAGTKAWTPANYDKQLHGLVALHKALAHSYNIPTVKLGMELGVPAVLQTIRRLGIERELPPYPSVFLGAVQLTPMEVAQMYQIFAGGGFQTPLRAIREVVSAKGEPLQRYGLAVQQVFDPAAVYLLNIALQEVVSAGTATSLYDKVSPSLAVAGKTGTTDDLRDSWFAGFTGDRMAVVWLGRDDNQSAGLTGANGALRVWGDIIKRIGSRPLELIAPTNVEWLWVDGETGLRSNESCPNAVKLPFVEGSAPTDVAVCAQNDGVDPVQETVDWLKDLFQ